MKTKKREKEVPLPGKEDNKKADLEAFLQTFEKPTKIYRYLKTRHLVNPIILQRNLCYMQHRRTVGHSNRKSFRVDSLLERKQEHSTSEAPTDNFQPKYLKLEFTGFYDKQVPAQEVEVEAILTKISKRRKIDSPVKQRSLGKVKIPANPEVSATPHKSIMISPQCIYTKKGPKTQSYVLHLSVTCHVQRSLPNGVCNGEARENDEPSPKKRKSIHDEPAIHVEDDVIVYGTELSVFDRRESCLLKSGDYDLILQELGSKYPSKKEYVWETAYGRKQVDDFEVPLFTSVPVLKFALSWADSATGDVRVPSPQRNLLLTLQSCDPTCPPGFDVESAAQRLKEETQSTPEKDVHVTYNFRYNENTRQQTDTRENLNCPWCSLGCGNLYSLLQHLRLYHARFNFIYVPQPGVSRVDVSVNDLYDGAYAGNPHDINSHIGFAFHRLRPVRRTSYTHVLVYRPKRPVPSLTEFYEHETENHVSRQIIQGHNRLYYRTNTCLSLKPQEINDDSEDEATPLWLQHKTVNMIDEFSDVNEGEKKLMKLWNLHCMKYSYIADCQLPQACETFVDEHGRAVIEQGIMGNFLLHMVNLFDFSLIRPETVQRTLWHMNMIREDVEMNGTSSLDNIDDQLD